MAEKNTYDAIVIGSGISGGWAAKELCEKGLKVLLLERGRNVEHIKDYIHANTEPWDYEHRNIRTREMIAENPVLKRDIWLHEKVTNFFVNDQDCPYTEIKRFDWFRGYQVGGRSLTWGRQCLRMSDLDFEANAKEGIATDWPIRYKEIEQWYTYVEKYIGIVGTKENIPHLPDGHYLPKAMEMNIVEKDVAKRIAQNYKNRKLIIGRFANITQAMPNNRNACMYRGKCVFGCPLGAYFSTQSTTLPAAIDTGNLTLRPYSIVTQILFDKDKKRATGVEILDTETLQTYVYHAKIIFLNASTFNSAWILMNSATNVWPQGLGSSSGELGHNIMDHHLYVGASADVEGFDDKIVYGKSPVSCHLPRYRNVYDDKRNYLRGFSYQGWASREGYSRSAEDLGIGLNLKKTLSEPGKWSMQLTGFGEVLPYHENKVSLDKNKKDKWGLPVLAFDAELKENEKLMRVDMQNDAVEMLETIGLKNVQGFDNDSTIGRAIHEMGTARMGNSPKNSVLNKWNQIWDAPNVFVTDGSFMTSSGNANPSLTYMAFTARAANYAVEQLKKQNL